MPTANVSGGTLNFNNAGATGLTTVNQSAGALNLNGAAATTLSALNMTGGTLSNAAALDIATLNMTSPFQAAATGRLSGAGAVNLTGASNITATEALTVASGLTVDGAGKVLTNSGTLTLAGNAWTANDASAAAFITLANGASLVNSGTLNMNGAAINAGAVSNGGFSNLGTITTGTGGSLTRYYYLGWQSAVGTANPKGGSINVGFSNSGTVNGNAGTLTLGGSNTSSGAFNLATGSALTLSGPTTLTGGSMTGAAGVAPVVNVTGALTLSNTTPWILDNITLNKTGATTVTQGVLPPGAVSEVTMQNGATINNTSSWTMNNATLTQGVGAAAAFNNNAGGSLIIPASGSAVFTNVNFTNASTLTVLGNFNTGSMTNAATGIINVDGASVLPALTQNGFVNPALTTVTTPLIAMNVTNDGTINMLNSGTITGNVINNAAFNVSGVSKVNRAFTNSATGIVNLNANSTLNVGGSSGGQGITNSGIFNAAAGSTINSPSFTNSAGTLTLNNATLNAGQFVGTSAGSVNLTNGSLLSSGASSNAGAIVTSGLSTLSSGADLLNSGAITSTAGGALTLQSVNNIVFGTGGSVTATLAPLNVILNSNSTGLGGAISLATGTSISSNGGNITLGGGAGTISAGVGFAQGASALGYANGVTVNGNLAAAGGNIVINGIADAVTNGLNTPAGVMVGGSVSTMGAGAITLTGKSMNSGSITMNPRGVDIGDSNPGTGIVSAVDGAILIDGTGGSAINAMGALIYNGSTVQTTGLGSITINGTAGNGVVAVNGTLGVDIQKNSVVRTNSGVLTLNGTNTSTGLGIGTIAYGVHINGSGALPLSTDVVVASTSGAINITGSAVAGVGKGVVIDTPVVTNKIGNGTSGNILIQSLNGSGISLSGADINTTGSFTLDAAGGGAITPSGGSVSAGTFNLLNGTWSQVGTVLPAFSANDFRIRGGTFIRALGGNGTAATPYQLADIYGVQGMGSAGMLGNSYVLANAINAAGTATWNAGAGFNPIGNFAIPFTGSLNGNRNSISSLFVNRPATDYVGLLGLVSAASRIQNVGLVNANVSGNFLVGSLAGSSQGNISNSYATGSLRGISYIGGLIGENGVTGVAANSYSTVNVDSASLLGGSYVGIGGFAGYNAGIISNSYATGTVRSGASPNGATVPGFGGTGGFVGTENINLALVPNGGIKNSYSTGVVTGPTNAGGLVGLAYSNTVTNSFWNVNTSGLATSARGTGLTTAQMMQSSSFASWNTTPNTLSNVGGSGALWRIYDGNTAPLLTSFMTALTLPDNTGIYSGIAQTGASYATPNILGIAATGTNAGFYKNGYYSNQQGYDIIGGNLTITPKVVSLSGTKPYDGTAVFTGGTDLFVTTGIGTETLALTGTASTLNKNVGNTNLVNGGTLSIANGTGLASNYTLAGVNLLGTVRITPANLNIKAATDTRVYDGSLNSAGVVTFSGLIGGDSVTGATQSFVSKNVMGVNGSQLNVNTGYTVNDGNMGGNYAVTTNTATGTITPLASVAWIGGANGLWSNSANWAGGALPDGSNVLAVNLPAGSSLTYDLLTPTNLQTLTSAGSLAINTSSLSIGNFTMTGGNLVANGAFNAAQYAQTGGVLSAASVNVSNAFSQTGGTLSATGGVVLNTAGAIVQTAPAGITAASLIANAVGGIGLNGANRITTLTSMQNTVSGNIGLFNTSVPLTIGSVSNGVGNVLIDNTGGIVVNGAMNSLGAFDLFAHSPITVNASGSISAGGAVTLTAGAAASPVATDVITLNGLVSGSRVTLSGNSVAGTIPAGALMQLPTIVAPLTPAAPAVVPAPVVPAPAVPAAPVPAVPVPAAPVPAAPVPAVQVPQPVMQTITQAIVIPSPVILFNPLVQPVLMQSTQMTSDPNAGTSPAGFVDSSEVLAAEQDVAVSLRNVALVAEATPLPVCR